MSDDYDDTLTAHQLLQLMYASDEEDRRNVLFKMAEYTMMWQRLGKTDELNALLLTADASRLTRQHASALLRYTFARREFLPAWEDCRDRIVARFENDSDFKSVFTGLTKDRDKYYEQKSGYEGAFDRLIGIHPNLRRD